MRKIFTPCLLIAALCLGACSSSDDPVSPPPPPPPPPPPAQYSLQLLHASPDAPTVNVLANEVALIPDVDYKDGSEIFQGDADTLSIRVDGNTPGGTVPVLGPVDIEFQGDTLYSIVAVGNLADIEALVLEQPAAGPAAGASRLRVLHAAPAAPEVDVYATTPGADLTATAPLGTFEFQGDLGPVEVTAGDYQIRVTVAGDPAAVVFDSGTVALADGDDFLIAAVENTTTGDSPISLVVLNGSGSLEIFDVATPADLRVVHASPDAPAVDIVVNDDFANPLVPNLAFPDFTDFVSVPADTYNVKVTDSATQGVVPIDVDLTLEAANICGPSP